MSPPVGLLLSGVSASTGSPSLSLRDVFGISCSRGGLEVRISVGEETLALFLSGEVSMMLGDMELKRFGEGREDVGLIFFTAEEN